MKRYAVVTFPVIIAFTIAGLLLSAPLSAQGSDRVSKKSFDMEKGKRLELDINVGGDILIRGWQKDQVDVEVVINGRDRDDIEIDYEQRPSVLKVELGFEKKFRRNRADIRVIVSVPGIFDISFKTMGGDVDISGVEGEIVGITYGGDIDFMNLDGEVDVKTMGGDITVSESRLDGTVKTMGGDIRIEDVTGDLKGSTMGGDVTYDGVTRNTRADSKRKGNVDEGDDEVSISTLGGDLNLDYEGKSIKARTFGGDINVKNARDVKVSTMGGDIEVAEAPEGADAHTMGGDIIIERAGKFARAKTMGGDIEVREIDGRVTATTMGGDVRVRIVGSGGGDRDVELKSMGGDVELTVPKGYSMEFDIEISYTKKNREKCGIVSDFPMDIKETGEWKSKWGQKRKYIYGTGEVNGGEHKIVIRTINGKVFVKEE